MANLPGPLLDVVEQLSRLPGLGPKSALRIGLTLLQMPRQRAEGLGGAIVELRRRLCLCERCGSLSEASPCSICADPSRDGSELCVVPEWDSLLAMEEMGTYKGLYFVLGGLLSPLDGQDAGALPFDRLRQRLAEGEVTELIVALGATVDAEATASHVRNMLDKSFPDVRLTRLAQGIPMGAEVKYMDKETLRQSLLHRQKL